MLRLLKNLILLGIFLAIAAISGFVWLVNQPVALKADKLDFHIASGSGMRTVARQVVDAGVEMNPWVLIIMGRALQVDGSIKAGSYEISQGITPYSLLKKLTRGDVTQTEIAFIEGWTFKQMREKLDAHPDLRHDTRGLSEAEIMILIGASGKAAEGRFFPDTYMFPKYSRDVEVLSRAYRTMQRHLEREWEARTTGLPYKNIDEMLIMASIVEKETGRDADRPLVAAVFVNRLRLGMLLQTDPTVIYGMGERFRGNIRKQDLLTDTPYNTYTRAGLPPTPIAMPGLASVRASLHPADSQALYFVARGDGSSQFSRTLDEHNQAVNRYQRGGK